MKYSKISDYDGVAQEWVRALHVLHCIVLGGMKMKLGRNGRKPEIELHLKGEELRALNVLMDTINVLVNENERLRGKTDDLTATRMEPR